MSEAQTSAKPNVETWGALINGEVRPAASGKTFPTFNPGNGEMIAYLAECDEEDIDAAVRAALAAFPAWRKMTGAARAKRLMKLAQLVEQHGPKLAELESLNAGKPIRDSKAIDAVTVCDPPATLGTTKSPLASANTVCAPTCTRAYGRPVATSLWQKSAPPPSVARPDTVPSMSAWSRPYSSKRTSPVAASHTKSHSS